MIRITIPMRAGHNARAVLHEIEKYLGMCNEMTMQPNTLVLTYSAYHIENAAMRNGLKWAANDLGLGTTIDVTDGDTRVVRIARELQGA